MRENSGTLDSIRRPYCLVYECVDLVRMESRIASRCSVLHGTLERIFICRCNDVDTPIVDSGYRQSIHSGCHRPASGSHGEFRQNLDAQPSLLASKPIVFDWPSVAESLRLTANRLRTRSTKATSRRIENQVEPDGGWRTRETSWVAYAFEVGKRGRFFAWVFRFLLLASCFLITDY